jgi:SAM-dependent methyltransferase
MSRHIYDKRFLVQHGVGSARSAEVVVPLIMESLAPTSVVDVGCGLGNWLQSFRKHGVQRVLGVDGPWVDPDLLTIPRSRFVAHDLTAPLDIDERYDLVVCLEVAEHLPPECASTLVRTLTSLGPAVLFSAAAPFQGGDGHINEQWPRYWGELFSEKGYAVIDYFRSRLWLDRTVDWWYAQNMLLFLSPELNQERQTLSASDRVSFGGLPVVHPRLLDRFADPSVGWLLSALIRVVPRRLNWRLRRLARSTESRIRRQRSG